LNWETFDNNINLGIHTIFLLSENIAFLEEWIIYHIALGFSKIYLYDNTGSIGRGGSTKDTNKYNIKFNDLINIDEKQQNTLLQEILDKYPQLVYVKWTPKNDKGEIIYAQEKCINHYVKEYKNDCDWTAFIDIDEFIVLDQKYNLKDYIKEKGVNDINKIIINQKKFGERFCNITKNVVEIDDCIENIDTSSWAPKNIIKNNSIKISDKQWIHNIQTSGKSYLAPLNECRYNHYNLNKKQFNWMKGFYKKDKFDFGKDTSLSKYKTNIVDNTKYLNIEAIKTNFDKYCINADKENIPETPEEKKIALCFLIYDKINHEELWNNFLKNVDRNKYNIYIHYKTNKPLKYFEKNKIDNCIETSWGDVSIVVAQNILLIHALKDKNNKHFIWLSDSCVPLKSFNYIYNYLDTNKSYYNKSPDSQVFPRADKVLKYVKKNNIKKANMASVINRKHAELFVNNDKNIRQWFKDIPNVDEIVYITLLYHNNLQNELVLTPNIAAGSIIFAQWSDMSNYKLFKKSKKINDYTYSFICPEELDYLIKSKSLIGRKFAHKCKGLDKLYEL